jgi:HD-GYP domain-containing protein (c-di-GMP phosphodiesterase class II)
VTDGPNGNWYARLLSATGGSSDTYSHAADVSTYAALFGIALGLKTIEDLALAGLLHDIGLAKVPGEITAKDPSEWTEAEKQEYEKHPGHSIEMIRDRKLVVSDLVYRIISQHHEAYNGTGYPKALAGNRICLEAQVLALADRFADLMIVRPGHPRKTPIEAIAELHKLVSDDPGASFVEPALLKRVLALFPIPDPSDVAA